MNVHLAITRVKRLYSKVWSRLLSPNSNRIFSKIHRDELTITHDGLNFDFDTSSVIVKRWFFPRYRDGSLHEPVISRYLLNSMDSESVFFDLGANVGYYTVLGSTVCSEVHAFEMDPRLVSIIAQHMDKNQTGTSTQIIPAAVSDHSGSFISFSPHQTGNPSTNMALAEAKSKQHHLPFQMQTIAIDDYVNQTNVQPTIVKIDVEGLEALVLDGFSKTIGKVQTLLLEVHPSLLSRHDSTVDDVLQRLTAHGFSCQKFSDHRANQAPEELLEPIDNQAEINQNSMLLCER